MVDRALVLVAALACACTIPHKLGEANELVDDGSDVTGGATTDGETGTGSMSSTSATSVSATATTTGVGDPYAACGVEIDNSGPTGLWLCGCSVCNIEQMNLTPESRASFQGACDCLCEEFGCGFPTTASTGNHDDGATISDTDTSGEGEGSTSTTSGGDPTSESTGLAESSSSSGG